MTPEQMRDAVKANPGWITLGAFTRLKIVAVTPRTLRNWCETGTYPHAVKRGGQWFVNVAQFLEWFEKAA